MAGLKDELEYIAFCKNLLQSANDVKQSYMNLSEDNKAKFRSQAMELLKSSGLAELLGIHLE